MSTIYLPLHTHSHFSLLRGVPDIPELVSRAKAYGFPALALADTNHMGGMVLFIEECRRQGIQPLYGIEWRHEDNPDDELVLLAKNAAGYKDLCQLSTKFFCRETREPLYQLFEKSYRNLVVLTSSPTTLLGLYHSPMMPQLFGELICQDLSTKVRAKEVEQLADYYRIPLVATDNAFFLDAEEFETHKIMRAIDENTTLDKVQFTESPNAYLRKSEQVERIFKRRPDALANTVRIWKMCTDDLNPNPWIMPRLRELEKSPEETLRDIAEESLQKVYGGTPQEERARTLMERELAIIKEKGYSSYFLMVRKLRHWANEKLQTAFRRPKDCTTLRGSAANSIVLYLIGGSDLCPLRYNLYFERFLNPERKSPPDVDLDFGWDERDDILNYVFEEWGEENVAVMCTTNKFKWRSAFRQVAKVFGKKDLEISKFIKEMGPGNFYPKSTAFREHEAWLRVAHLARTLLGKPYFLSQHCGGVLVTNEPIATYTACQKSGGLKNRKITQIDMHSGIDYLGLIKFDLLGNGSLSVLRDTLLQLEEQGEKDPEVWDLEKCYEDPKVHLMMTEGRTKGVFYLESPAQSRLNKKARSESFEEIGITSSLIRPAGTKYTDLYIQRERALKAGEKSEDYFLHPSLKTVLGDTHDVCVFQEDIIKICVEIAGLSFGQADRVRKMMNSLHEGIPDDYEKTADAFKQGCVDNKGFTPEQADSLWERIQSFQGFSFCKSHSLSYAQLSFQCAYLKAHFPAAFMAAVISNNHGFYHYSVYFDEAKRLGIEILPLCVNESEHKHFGKGRTIRFGFMHMRQMTQGTIREIIRNRKTYGPFLSLADFKRRIHSIRQGEVERLIQVGAFDCFGLPVSGLFHLWSRLQDASVDQLAMPLYEESRRVPQIVQTFQGRCYYEQKYLGYMLSGDVLEMLDHHPRRQGTLSMNRLRFYVGKTVAVLGAPVARRMHRVQKSGETMLFLTLHDRSDSVDVVVWPREYAQWKHLLHEEKPLRIEGVVQEEYGTYSLEFLRAETVPFVPVQVPKKELPGQVRFG